MDSEQRISERALALFLLGLVLFSPPLLAVFTGEALTLGVPPLVLYLFGAWTALIVLLALVVRGAGEAGEPPER